VSPVLETVTIVLVQAGKPMRVREIHAAAEDLVGESLLGTSVKAALAAGVSGPRPRFRRVRHGVYKTAKRDTRRPRRAEKRWCQRDRDNFNSGS